MTLKQKTFCEHYVSEYFGNAVGAAIAAGYAENYSRKHAFELLEKPDVTEYISELSQAALKDSDTIATIEEIHAFWSDVMRNEENRTADRLRAAELLAKCKGAFNSSDW